MTRSGRWEWAFAVDAVARGDLLVLLDDDRSAARPVSPGDRFWLLPSWRDERREAVAERWWRELAHAHATAHDGPDVPLRALCAVVSSHALDEAARARIARHHPWSPAHAARAARALVVRAWARPDPWPASVADDEGRWPELAAEPPEDGLLPALTDEAFALHRAELARDMEATDAARG